MDAEKVKPRVFLLIGFRKHERHLTQILCTEVPVKLSRGQPANPSLPGKNAIKIMHACVCVCVLVYTVSAFDAICWATGKGISSAKKSGTSSPRVRFFLGRSVGDLS